MKKSNRSKTVSTMVFDGTLDCYNSIRKFVGDQNISFIALDRNPNESFIEIKNDLCRVYVTTGGIISKDQNGKFSVRKPRKGKGYAGDL